MNEFNIIYRSKHPKITGKEEEIISSHIHSKIPLAELARLYDCDRKPIQNMIKKNGYTLRSSTSPLLEGNEEEILKMYVEDKLTIQTIRKKIGISYCALQNFLKRNNVELRTAEESKQTEDGKVKGSPRKLLNSKDLNNVVILYHNGNTLTELSEIYNMSPVGIRLKLLKHGVTLRTADEAMSNPRVLEKIKQTCLKKYGVENPMQCPEIFNKSNKNGYKFKSVIINGIEFNRLQGYEPQGLRYLLDNINVTAEQLTVGVEVPSIRYYLDGNRKRYYPDIYIKHLNMLVEVKSVYTYHLNLEKNIAKREAAVKKGYNYKTIIFSNNGKDAEEVLDFIS